MAHMIEEIDGKPLMAFVGETPWHGLGNRVGDDLTPEEFLVAAGLDWEVTKSQNYTKIGKKFVPIEGEESLIRSSDEKILSTVSGDWNPVQNREAFEFFREFCDDDQLTMETAGSLDEGRTVWALAKLKESFKVGKRDKIESRLLFTNYHKYGFSTDVRLTNTRVVCNNTLTLALSGKAQSMVKVSHRRSFDGENVKELLGITSKKIVQFKEAADFLASKRYTEDGVIAYFDEIFPTAENANKQHSKNAALAFGILETQPGSSYAPGSWFNAMNAVTFLTSHIQGRTNDNRLNSLWYGQNKDRNMKALTLATEYAKAA